MIARVVAWIRFAFKFARMLGTPMWRAADEAARHVAESHALRHASGHEERTSFCPRCGQIPDGDRRMEEARELFLEKWKGAPVRRSELDFALAWAYCKRKL